MSQQPPDEEFERRLRDVFRSRGLGVPVSPDALDRIHSGARRRQQHRTAMSITAAFLVVAITGVGVGIRNIEHHTGDDQIAAGSHTPLSSPLASPVSTSSAGRTSPDVSSSSAATLPTPPSSALATPTFSPAAPTHYPSAGSAVPADFVPSSVTAVNAKTFWVLGAQKCEQQQCTAIAHTTDGGAHFTEIAAPHAATIAIDNSTRVVYNLRFADDNNGWAYGQALWTTADGGATWTDTSLPAGSVTDLEAARNPGAVSGTAWAVVQPIPFTSGYQLWEAPYTTGTGTGSWQQVDLGNDPPGDTAPSLVVKGATAYLLSADAKNVGRLYVATVGSPATMYAAPCNPAGAAFSAGIGSLWTVCPTTGIGPHAPTVSTDGGATWHAVLSPPDVVPGAVGGIDATTAVEDQGPGLVVVSTTAGPKTAAVSGKNANFSFIGFTDANVGYALSREDRLWRTTDAGVTWKVVTF